MNKEIKILVVDDHSTIRKIIKGILINLGYKHITEAVDGAMALELLQDNDFDFLITDWNMPELQGIDLLKAIRADRRLDSLPVLLLTAEATRQQIVDAMNAGVDAYVVKPFTTKTIQEKMEFIFSRMEAAA